jgi:hypothetical protein
VLCVVFDGTDRGCARSWLGGLIKTSVGLVFSV